MHGNQLGHSPILTSLFVLAVITLTVDAEAPPPKSTEPGTDTLAHLEQHLETLEEELRQRVEIARRASSPDAAARTESELTEMLLYLRRIDRSIRELEGVDAIPLLGRLDVLRRLAETREAEHLVAGPVGTHDKTLADGQLIGVVTDAATGDPISNVRVHSVNDRGTPVGPSTTTDSQGQFTLTRSPDTYFLFTQNSSGFIDEVLGGPVCLETFTPQCRPESGTPVVLGAGQRVTSLDFELRKGATITGRVVDAATSQGVRTSAYVALAGTEVILKFGSGSESGVYTVSGLPSGEYIVGISSRELRDELYDDIPCEAQNLRLDHCDTSSAIPLSATEGETISGIDFAVDRAGVISGLVTAESDGSPVNPVQVALFDGATGHQIASDSVFDGSGAYMFGGLDPGTYFVGATARYRFLDEIHDDLPCPRGPSSLACDARDGTPVEISYNSRVRIDFELSRLGTISGTVRARDTGEPLPGTEIRFRDENNDLAAAPTTDELGRFFPTGLYPGAYTLSTDNNAGYLDEIYQDVPCDRLILGGCRRPGTPVPVELETVTSGIDFDLAPSGRVTGTLTDSATGDGITGQVIVYDGSGRRLTSGSAGSDGVYEARGLSTGSYFLVAFSHSYAAELHDALPCVGICDTTAGTLVDVTAGAATTIDFSLDRLGAISGRVTDELTGAPLPRRVVAFFDSESIVRSTVTDDQGLYSASGFETGTYFAGVRADDGYPGEIYRDLPCEGRLGIDCDVRAGTPIQVTRAVTTTGIDFSLRQVACQRGRDFLCLNQERFEVEVAWEDPRGNRGSGTAVELTDDSGYYWFFRPDNVEIVVKVLDGCSTSSANFWVFAAGLTNVGTEITVTDTLTSAVRRYSNPVGNDFQPILDTRAFDTCDAAPPASSAVEASPLPEPPLVTVPKQGGCSTQGSELCLNAFRFLVEATWRTRSGQTGQARAVALTTDTGYFWFFGPDNVEVVVKVIRACNLNPFNNYWVFVAGLTTVEVTLRVTDTVTGQVQEYFNRQGDPFKPVLDTSAFDVCF